MAIASQGLGLPALVQAASEDALSLRRRQGPTLVHRKMRRAVSNLQVSGIADVLLLQPARSLSDQIAHWARQRPGWRIAMSFARKLPEIRKVLDQTNTAIVDATEDPCLAAEGFLQAVTQLGASAVTMYTEVTHRDLELLVRVRGSLFLLGPLWADEWEGFFDGSLRRPKAASIVQMPAGRRWLRHWREAAGECRTLVHRVQNDRHWPSSGVH
jgi:hypothetical protein